MDVFAVIIREATSDQFVVCVDEALPSLGHSAKMRQFPLGIESLVHAPGITIVYHACCSGVVGGPKDADDETSQTTPVGTNVEVMSLSLRGPGKNRFLCNNDCEVSETKGTLYPSLRKASSTASVMRLSYQASLA